MDAMPKLEFVVDVDAEIIPGPTSDGAVIELNEIELTLVGGGGGDVHF